MQLNKTQSLASITQASKSQISSLLVLKKTISSSEKEQIVFDFSDPMIKEESQNWSVSQFLPVFNKDRKYYTPTFILKIDEAKYQLRDSIYKSLHQDRIQLNNQEKSQLLIPKPFQFNRYCIVCKKDFQDYLQHINQNKHMKKMRQSQFCQDINKLCKKIQKVQKKSSIKKVVLKKQKPIKKVPKQLKNRKNN